MTSKVLTIQVASDERAVLLNSGYLLCIATTSEGQPYDIVWRAFDKYLSTNTFSWTPQYELFMTNSFTSGQVPGSTSESGSIVLGQQMTLDSTGVFGPPSSGNYPDALTILNEYGNTYLGFSQMSTGIDNTSAITYAYVGPNITVQGVIQLEPVDMLLVWFETNVQTGTMFSVPPVIQPPSLRSLHLANAQSFAIEVDMTNSSTATIQYGSGGWSKV